MSALFYFSGIIAVVSAIMVIMQTNVMRALISLVLLLLSIASVFYTLGGPFAAVLQIVIYAGAIVVLFVFVVMMLDLRQEAEVNERKWLGSVFWALPVALAAALLIQFAVTLASQQGAQSSIVIPPKDVGISLFTDYFIGVELASILLLAALVAAFHFGGLPIRKGGDNEQH